jgi:hypothetical protein
MANVWVNISIFFFGNLSVSTPANKEKKVTGKNCIVPTSPSKNGDPVKESTSQDCPMFCVQVPIKEIH